MTSTRRVPIKAGPSSAQPSQGGESVASGGIQFKNLVRKTALDVREVADPSASTLYNLCRAKANQVMMMKHRGYTIPPEEQTWLDCSLKEEVLIQKIRTLLGMKIQDIIKNVMNRVGPKAYVLEKQVIPTQTTYNYYPYLESEGSEVLKVGEFFFRNGRWELNRTEDRLVETIKNTTEVLFVDDLNLGDYSLDGFKPVAGKIAVYVGEEKDFRKELEKLVVYRRQGVEIFHISELFIDYFQHWLIPKQEILGDIDKIKLLASHLMIRSGNNQEFKKIPNCQITESNLPSIHHTDIVIRYLGALPGQIISWSNDSYISSFSTKEFGYMLVVGHKYSTSKVEENLFPGEQRTIDENYISDEDEELEEMEELEELDEGDDFGAGAGEDED